MMRLPVIILLCFVYCSAIAQTVEKELSNGVKLFKSDSQLKHAILGFYVLNAKTGAVVYDENSQVGLAPASTQKVITSVAAYELLGKDFKYETRIGYDGTIQNDELRGNLYIIGSGDPTLGSDRWAQTRESVFKQHLAGVLKANKILSITGNVIIDASGWETQATQNGWIWEDIGNYYGAGVWGLNWHENQYDLILKPGNKAGDDVSIVKTVPELFIDNWVNELKTGATGSGDNSIIYLPENGKQASIRGTIPAGVNNFTVKGSISNAPEYFAKMLEGILKENKTGLNGKVILNKEKLKVDPVLLSTISSPVFDSINYWFLNKSVNLFGEAFVKTIAFSKNGFGTTKDGLDIIKDFWGKNGIEKPAIKIIDGSGLSPANRVTTDALVKVMQYAKGRSWFPSFYKALPEQNGIKMKSGYISGVRSYTGYIKSKNGQEYTFAIIVNNFDGNAGSVREKMYKLLDILK